MPAPSTARDAPPSDQELTSSRSERTRRRILAAAGTVFAEFGYAKATVEEIARCAGVSKALVYVYFSGKESLLELVLERTLEDWRRYTWSRVARAETALEGVGIMHRASLEFARRHPVLRTILARDDRLLLAGDDEPVRRATEGWRQRLTELLTSGVASGEIRTDLDIGRAADAVSLWHVAYLDRLYAESLYDVSDDQLVEQGIDLILHGLTRVDQADHRQETQS